MPDHPFSEWTLERYEREFARRHRLHDVIDFWAERKPDAVAIIFHDEGCEETWRSLKLLSEAVARELLAAGFRKGDFLACSLPFTRQHVALELACFRIGAIHVPLDLRLSAMDVVRALEQLRPRAYVYDPASFGPSLQDFSAQIQVHCPWLPHLLETGPEGCLLDVARNRRSWAPASVYPAQALAETLQKASRAVSEYDGAQVIFTTGSTGPPKPALLTHRSITAQNMSLGAGFRFGENTRILVNLPPSHVGGQAEILLTALFWGGIPVVLKSFDPRRSLEAVEKHRVNLLGQIPAMFYLEWRLPGYSQFDLSNLELVVYGGQSAPLSFVQQMAQMAPRVATGLGLTEASGFCTYTRPGATAEEVSQSLGYATPAYPFTIRAPMREDGLAGEELPEGETGHICFRGPQTFAGYVGDPEATRKTISRDGFLYTGDLGYQRDGQLYLRGRAKWVIKVAGYQVFPADVEQHFSRLTGKVACCAAVGVEHKLFGEAIVLFVERRPGVELAVEELRQHARSMTRYMRPLHYVFLEPGQMPLNRAGKIDYVRLSEQARQLIKELRRAHHWDPS